jgi:hypothetical protein
VRHPQKIVGSPTGVQSLQDCADFGVVFVRVIFKIDSDRVGIKPEVRKLIRISRRILFRGGDVLPESVRVSLPFDFQEIQPPPTTKSPS